VGLTNFSILLPLVSGKSGLNLGFYQHTNTNYGIKSIEVDPTFGTYAHQRTGVGNLYRAFIGAGFRFGKLKIGGNIITQFGRNDYLDDVRFTDSLLMPVLRKRDAVTQLGLDYNLGTQYELEIDNSKQLIFGAYYNGNLFKSGSTDKISQNLFPTSSTSSEYVTLQDTNYSVDLPSYSKFGIGMSFINKKSLLVGTEFNYENYSNFTDRFTGQNLNNAWHLHFGVEYKPYMNRDNDTRKYFNRVTYRLGSVLGKSEQLYTGSFNELKFMGGATLPILGRNVGYITLGMEYATRGFGGNAQIADNILSFNLILTFADKWFLRQKFD